MIPDALVIGVGLLLASWYLLRPEHLRRMAGKEDGYDDE